MPTKLYRKVRRHGFREIATRECLDSQTKLQRSLLASESEFLKVSLSSSVSTDDERITAEPRRIQADEPVSDSNRYVSYDNRPIKPLDKNLLQCKLSEYPVDTQPHR